MRSPWVTLALAIGVVGALAGASRVNRSSAPVIREGGSPTIAVHGVGRERDGQRRLAGAGARGAVRPAATRTYTYFSEPLGTGDYSTHWVESGARHPRIDGFVIAMHARLVDRATGRPVSIATAMLHHLYFTHVRDAGRDDRCAGRPSGVFYSTGEEDETLRFPSGYGYRLRAKDRWRLTAMIMSHTEAAAEVTIEYTLTVSRDRSLVAVDPFWLRANGCEARVAYPVAGGGRRGSRYLRIFRWRVPFAGRIVAASGHLHGGALKMWLTQPRCRDRRLLDTNPRYGMPSDLRYHLDPVLHEPGPMDTRTFLSRTGIAVRAGETIDLKAAYDDHHPHWAVMAVMHVYLARAKPAASRCRALPRDRRELEKRGPARTAPPVAPVPLSRLDARGRPHTMPTVAAPSQRRRSGLVVTVDGSGFSIPHLSLPTGASLTWRFPEPILHDATFASGPQALGALPTEDGGTVTVRLRVPGRYRFFCSLHPMTMHEEIDVGGN
jgi:plastocyanin